MAKKMRKHTEILPCPKCKSKAKWFDYCGDGAIYCTNKECGYHGDNHRLYNVWVSYDAFEVIEDATLEWNANR